jgi:ADP-heptose:LPS heptosyltransferase
VTKAVLRDGAPPLEIVPSIRELIVFQLWGIGDMIWSTPALAILRKRFGGVPLTVIANSNAEAQVIRGSHLCDEVKTVGRRWKRLGALLPLVLQWRFRERKAAVLMPGMSFRLAQGLRYLGGFDHVIGGTFSDRPSGYTHWTRLSPDTHYLSMNLAIVRQVCGDAGEAPMYFHIDAESEERAARWWKEQGLTDQVAVGIHPGAGAIDGIDKRFPLEKALFTIRRLQDRMPDLQIVIYLGPDERDLVSSFRGLGPRVRLMTDMPLRPTAAIIKRTRVHVGGDSGLGHIASAVGVPVVSVFGPTMPERFRPLGERCTVHKADAGSAPSCMPCYDSPTYGHCPISQRCLHVINYDRVVDSIVAAICDLSVDDTKVVG